MIFPYKYNIFYLKKQKIACFVPFFLPVPGKNKQPYHEMDAAVCFVTGQCWATGISAGIFRPASGRFPHPEEAVPFPTPAHGNR